MLRTLSILRFLQVRVFCGGWNPHRGFRHGGRSGSRGVGGVSGIVMTDCGAAHAIHPPIFGIWFSWRLESASRLPTWRWCGFTRGWWCFGNCHDGLRCFARYPSSGCSVLGVGCTGSMFVFLEVGIRIAASDMAVVRVHAGLVVFRKLS